MWDDQEDVGRWQYCFWDIGKTVFKALTLNPVLLLLLLNHFTNVSSIFQSCDAGTYTNTPASEFCEECPGGYACFTEGTTDPIQCAAGQFASNGSAECYACPEAHYCPSIYQDPIYCEEGKYSAGTGQTECSLCEAGQMCPDRNSSLPCPAGYYSNQGDGSCSACNAGYYRWD